MTEKEILDRINEIIVDEKGYAVAVDGMFLDAELDSLGTLITFITIDSEFHIFEPDVEIDFEDLDISNLTMRDLVVKCESSISDISTEQNNEKNT